MQPASYALPGVGRIPLRKRDGTVRAYATVDLADFPQVAARTWCVDPRGYVVGYVRGSGRAGRRSETLHRFLLGLTPGDRLLGDHRDRDPLNNRRENLRAVPGNAANGQNRNSHPNATSKHRGVCWHAKAGKWAAQVTLMRQTNYLGLFTDELEAARVAAEFRRLHMPYTIESEEA